MVTQCGWIECQANEDNDEQTDAKQTQPAMRHTMKEPAERCAFQRPIYRDPLSIELNREDECDEKQRRTAEKRQLRVACRARERCAF